MNVSEKWGFFWLVSSQNSIRRRREGIKGARLGRGERKERGKGGWDRRSRGRRDQGFDRERGMLISFMKGVGVKREGERRGGRRRISRGRG